MLLHNRNYGFLLPIRRLNIFGQAFMIAKTGRKTDRAMIR